MAESAMGGGASTTGLTAFQKEALAKLQKGSALKDIVGLSDRDIEAIHRIGLNFAEQGKYEQAKPMFQFACLHAHEEPRYWSSLGNCRQMLKEYNEAIDAYMLGFLLDGGNPWPPIHMAVCFLANRDKENAANALSAAEETLADGRRDETARQRIAALRQAL
jgi:type III secretion system low calcium response chaperone LcrH/SycD